MTALVLAGGVALASVAYAVGSESGDGSAVAASATARRGQLLAETLGVDPTELQEALMDFREKHAIERRDDFVGGLARTLDKPAAEVRAALDALAADRRDRFATRLSAELGVDPADVRAALAEVGDDRPYAPFGFAAALAGKLGLDPGAVSHALRVVRPRNAWHPHHGRLPLRQLAAALDVTRGQLRKAFRDLRAGIESTWEDRRAELVAFLAERFDLSKAKVEEALPEFPGPGPRWRERRLGPGGPGVMLRERSG
jgi:Clp amino terminal domain, pathogenicity island component